MSSRNGPWTNRQPKSFDLVIEERWSTLPLVDSIAINEIPNPIQEMQVSNNQANTADVLGKGGEMMASISRFCNCLGMFVSLCLS